MVYEGLRQQTLDIDLTFEIANEDLSAFIAAVRDLKERLSLNIEKHLRLILSPCRLAIESAANISGAMEIWMFFILIYLYLFVCSLVFFVFRMMAVYC